MLPAGVIERIDLEEQRVYVNRTKDEIKGAPQYDETSFADDDYRARLSSYYAGNALS
jgi:hypothetical protein